MKIAICDDNIRDIEHIQNHILRHSAEHEIVSFTSAKDLLNRIYADNAYFDLLFLDVQMPDSDGWEIARELKQARSKLFIAMVTIHGEYIFACFDRVDWFAPKPVSFEIIAKILTRAQEQLFPKAFTFHEGKVEITLTAPEIIYLEVIKNTLQIHTTKGLYPIRMSLKKAKELLPNDARFVQIHNSFVINLDHYDGLKDAQVRLKNGFELKLSRTYQDTFYRALTNYAKER